VRVHPALVPTGVAARALGLSPLVLTRGAKAGRLTPAARTENGHCRWDLGDLRDQLRLLENTAVDTWDQEGPEVQPGPDPGSQMASSSPRSTASGIGIRSGSGESAVRAT
jgi:hypothetical protein